MKLKAILFWGLGGLLALIAIGALVVAAVIWSDDPFEWKSPKDQVMIDDFHQHREAFDSLRELAVQNGKVFLSESTLQTGNLSEGAQKASRQFLRETWPGMTVGVDLNQSIRFIFAGGGLDLPIGPDWAKGILYIPGDTCPWGTLTADLDHSSKVPDSIYLRQLEPHWFLFYQRYAVGADAH
jgi:hypothetical protein